MRRTSVLANPVLVGAVTVLVTVVAVFLSYNANNGLPFVPTKQLKVRIANGANLVRGNEVRSGGYRIGVVQDMSPVRLENNEIGAELTLKLDQAVGDVPVDSRFVIRPRSALGLKYLELTEGTSKQMFRDGDTAPLDQTLVPVDLDEFFEMFDEKTRDASQENLRGFGDAFAGRGRSLGRTVEELPGLFEALEPVMRNLSAKETDLKSFFKELGDTARVIAPISERNAQLFTFMADTFEAIGRDENALKSFIEKSPPTMDVAIDSFKAQRPFLRHYAEFGEALQPATRELRAALPTINRAIKKGIPVQRRVVALNRDLAGVMRSLESLTKQPTTEAAIRGLTATLTTLNPSLRVWGPTITVCNGWSYFWTFAAEHFSETDITGSAQRALLNSAGRQKNSLGTQDATGPANGEDVQSGNAQFLRAQDYPHAINDDGTADCESGQRGWLRRNAKIFPPEFDIARDNTTPGNQGPTFMGRPRVYDGQTFSRNPETGGFKDLPASEFGGR